MFTHKTDSGHEFQAAAQQTGLVAIQVSDSGAGGALMVNSDEAQLIAAGIREEAAAAIQLATDEATAARDRQVKQEVEAGNAGNLDAMVAAAVAKALGRPAPAAAAAAPSVEEQINAAVAAAIAARNQGQ